MEGVLWKFDDLRAEKEKGRFQVCVHTHSIEMVNTCSREARSASRSLMSDKVVVSLVAI